MIFKIRELHCTTVIESSTKKKALGYIFCIDILKGYFVFGIHLHN